MHIWTYFRVIHVLENTTKNDSAKCSYVFVDNFSAYVLKNHFLLKIFNNCLIVFSIKVIKTEHCAGYYASAN